MHVCTIDQGSPSLNLYILKKKTYCTGTVSPAATGYSSFRLVPSSWVLGCPFSLEEQSMLHCTGTRILICISYM